MARLQPASSLFNTNYLYRSTWSRPQDAVTAVLMSFEFDSEYSLDTATASGTDLVLTLPTRHYYVTAAGSTPPFSSTARWSPTCAISGTRVGELLGKVTHDRETTATFCAGVGFGFPCPENLAQICAASGVASMHRPQGAPATNASTVLGSTTLGLAGADGPFLPAVGTAGWIALYATGAATLPPQGLGSQPDSVRINLDTGETLTGRHTFFGLPVLGFFARTFNNGRLSCGTAGCQGNYGSAFPLRYSRALVVP